MFNLVISLSSNYILQKSLDFETVPLIDHSLIKLCSKKELDFMLQLVSLGEGGIGICCIA